MAAGAGAGRCHRDPVRDRGGLFTCTPAASAAASRSASPRPSSTARRTAGERPRRPGCRAGRAGPGSGPAGKADGSSAPGVPGRGPDLRPARPGVRRAAVRGARLRTARPHQEPVLGPPSALASGRQAGPEPRSRRPPARTGPGTGRRRPAQVPGCNYCHCGRGLCQHAPPAVGPGRAGPASAAGCRPWTTCRPSPPPDACLVPSCGRWTMPATPFCHTHCQGWRRPPAGPRRVRRRPRRSRPRVRVDRRALPPGPAAAGDPVRAAMPRG